MAHSLAYRTAAYGLSACLMTTALAPAAFAQPSRRERVEQRFDAQQLVNQATGEAYRMERDPHLRRLMSRARGIFLVPKYGQGGFIIGGRGGAGVLLARTGHGWSSPSFYDFGGLSFGAQIGGEAGEIALLLMTPKAVQAFENSNKVTLNAGAGLTVVSYSQNVAAGDVIAWSNTKGAYAGATVSANDIKWSEDKNRVFYGRNVTPAAILTGQAMNPRASTLRRALP